jgi:hypothetical protein
VLQRRKFGAVRVSLLAVVAVLSLTGTAQASTTLFNSTGTVCTVTNPCWQAGNFGLLVGLGTGSSATMALSGNSSTHVNVSGAVGFGEGDKISGGNSIGASTWGIIDFADQLTTTSNGPLCPDSTHRCSIPTTSLASDLRKITVSTNTTQQLTTFIDAAIADVKDISACWKVGGACQTSTMINGVSVTPTVTSVSGGNNLSATLGVAPNSNARNVTIYNVSGAALSNATAFQVQGDANDLVIINFASGTSATFSGGITIKAGSTITSDQILVNYLGANGLTIGTDGKTYNATFIDAGGTYTVKDSITINGRVLGGIGSLTYGSNNDTIAINAPADVGDAGLPEPSTWILMGTGIAGLVYFGRRRRQA